MELTAFEWVVIGGAASLAIGVIAFFLKRTMSRVDRHDEDINHIKQTYVTEDDLRKMESELKGEVRRLTDAVVEIKTNYLTTKDFYRSMGRLEQQVDKVYQVSLEQKGGGAGGE